MAIEQRVPYEPEKIYRLAEAFLDASSHVVQGIAQGLPESLLIPALVHRAFALELYFKCLLSEQTGSTAAINSGKKRGSHNLLELYQALPDATRHTLEQYNEEVINATPFFTKIKNEDPGYTGYIIDILTAGQAVFEKFRYLYESPLAPPIGYRIDSVIIATQGYIRQQHPEWVIPVAPMQSLENITGIPVNRL